MTDPDLDELDAAIATAAAVLGPQVWAFPALADALRTPCPVHDRLPAESCFADTNGACGDRAVLTQLTTNREEGRSTMTETTTTAAAPIKWPDHPRLHLDAAYCAAVNDETGLAEHRAARAAADHRETLRDHADRLDDAAAAAWAKVRAIITDAADPAEAQRRITAAEDAERTADIYRAGIGERIVTDPRRIPDRSTRLAVHQALADGITRRSLARSVWSRRLLAAIDAARLDGRPAPTLAHGLSEDALAEDRQYVGHTLGNLRDLEAKLDATPTLPAERLRRGEYDHRAANRRQLGEQIRSLRAQLAAAGVTVPNGDDDAAA